MDLRKGHIRDNVTGYRLRKPPQSYTDNRRRVLSPVLPGERGRLARIVVKGQGELSATSFPSGFAQRESESGTHTRIASEPELTTGSR